MRCTKNTSWRDEKSVSLALPAVAEDEYTSHICRQVSLCFLSALGLDCAPGRAQGRGEGQGGKREWIKAPRAS